VDRRIIDYIPPILQGVREFQVIAKTEQADFESAWEAANNLLDNNFIATADTLGVSRWESILGIAPRGTDTLDERKFAILAAIEAQAPYTMRQLEFQLAFLCGPDGYIVMLDHNNYFLKVLVELTARRNFDAVKELLENIVPANLILHVGLRYNQHRTLSRFTHAQMAARTHGQLRNEVLSDG